MAPKEPARPIPLEDLVRFLESRRILVTPREYLRLRTLLAAGELWTRPQLADAIAALVASRRDQLASLRTDLRDYFNIPREWQTGHDKPQLDDIDLAQVQAELESLIDSPHEPEKARTPWIWPGGEAERRRRKRALWLQAFILYLAAAVALGLNLLPSISATDDELSTPFEQTGTIDVLANDTVPALSFVTLIVLAAPGNGQVVIQANRALLYTPNKGFSGEDEMIYRLDHWAASRSARVKIQVQPPPGPDPPLPPGARMRTYPNAVRFGAITAHPAAKSSPPWVEILLALALLGLATAAALYFRASHFIELPEPLPWIGKDDSDERYWPGAVGGEALPWLDSDTLDRLSRQPMYRQLDEPLTLLDLHTTVERTVRGVRPELVYQRRRETLTVLFLVDEHARNLAWNRTVTDAVNGLRARGVTVETAFFRGTLADLYERATGRLHLPDLEDERWRYAVLIASDGKGLAADDGRRLEALATWPHAVWLDLREPRFWDESVLPASRAGLPLLPATAGGMLDAFDSVLSEKGRNEAFLSLAGLRRQGRLVQPRSSLRGRMIETLGDAGPWAQACAMIQPLPLALADLLRRRFFSELPAVAVGRLIALPGTRHTVAGLTFDSSVLALLRQDFAICSSEEAQVAVLQFLLNEIDKTEPLPKGELPGLAQLGWQAHRERVNLELDPDLALERLHRLTTTPVAPAIWLDLGPAVLPGRGRPVKEPGDWARIPLRRAPVTPRGEQTLARLAKQSGIETRKQLPWQPQQRVVVMLLVGLAILMGTLGLQQSRAQVVNGWSLQFQCEDGPPHRALDMPDAQLLVQSKSDESFLMAGGGTLCRRGRGDLEPLLLGLPGTGPHSISLAGAGPIEIATLPMLEGPAGRVEVEVKPGSEKTPCTALLASGRLTRLLCPERSAPPPLSWRQSMGDRANGKLISIGLEFFDETAETPAARALREALLASGAVDRLYRIPVDESFEPYIAEDLAPWGDSIQLVGFYSGSTTSMQKDLQRKLDKSVSFGSDRFSLGPPSIHFVTFTSRPWIDTLEQATGRLDAEVVLPKQLFEYLRASPAVELPPVRSDLSEIESEPEGTLQANELIGRTRTLLVGEEGPLRRSETSLGNWVADEMLAAFRDQGAQVAFINAGALRLNRNISPSGTQVGLTRRDLEEMVPFPTPLRLIRIKGSTLRAAVERAVRQWPGHGSWLQIAGFAFRFNGETKAVSELSLPKEVWGTYSLGSVEGAPHDAFKIELEPVTADEEILAVTTDFLVNPAAGDQDGYTMLSLEDVIGARLELKDVLLRALRAAADGISPEVEGRICLEGSSGPCLLGQRALGTTGSAPATVTNPPAPSPWSIGGALGTQRNDLGCPARGIEKCWKAETGLGVFWASDVEEKTWNGPAVTDERGRFSLSAGAGPLLLRAYRKHSLWRTQVWEQQVTAEGDLGTAYVSLDAGYEPFAEVENIPGDEFRRRKIILGLRVPRESASRVAEVSFYFNHPNFRSGQTDPYYKGRSPLLASENSSDDYRVFYAGSGALQVVTIRVRYRDSSRPLAIEFDHYAATRSLLDLETAATAPRSP